MKQFHSHFTSFFWLLISFGIIQSSLFLYDGANLLSLPYETSRPESFILHGAKQISQKLPLYPSIGEEPFIIHVYNPLTYIPTGLFGRAVNSDIPKMLFFGRSISFISSILLIILLSSWTWQQNKDWKSALFVGLAVLFYQTPTLTDFYRLRPESPALLFTFIGIVSFYSTLSHRVIISAIAFFIAFLFKQPFIIAPISLFLFMAYTRNYYNLIKFTSTLGGALILFFTTMYFITDENYFHHAVFSEAKSNVTPIKMLIEGHGKKLIHSSWGLILTLPIAFYSVTKFKKYNAILVYFILCLFWTFYTSGKSGSDLNYFSELSILAIIIIAICLGSKSNKKSSLLILAIVSTQILTSPIKRINSINTPNITPYVERYKNIPGRKLITHEGVAIHVGNVVGFDWFLLNNLQKNDSLSLDSIFDNINMGNYNLLVFSRNAYSEDLELRLFNTAQQGPYEIKFIDDLVVELHRTPISINP